jgi:hypothetical protein
MYFNGGCKRRKSGTQRWPHNRNGVVEKPYFAGFYASAEALGESPTLSATSELSSPDVQPEDMGNGTYLRDG